MTQVFVVRPSVKRYFLTNLEVEKYHVLSLCRKVRKVDKKRFMHFSTFFASFRLTVSVNM